MAQTIGIQRGSATISTNGTTEVTLFTQSTGTATRVIIGQLTYYDLAGASSTIQAGLVYTTSSQTKSVLFRLNVSSATHFSFVPGQQDSAATTTASNAASPYFGGIPFQCNDSTQNWQGAVQIANIQPQVSLNAWAIGPTNFWIGNGDTISAKIYRNNGTTTGYLGYSFITVTES